MQNRQDHYKVYEAQLKSHFGESFTFTTFTQQEVSGNQNNWGKYQIGQEGVVIDSLSEAE